MPYTRDPAGIQASELVSISDFKDKEVLEIGCGEGFLTFAYASQTAMVDAIDADSDSIERAKQSTPAELVDRIRFIATDIADFALALPGSRYDIAIFAWSL
jgi:2-polyprenyl-3-methyl-5-hydroxy-6-metoxy-1,4-benzoquinol methylase